MGTKVIRQGGTVSQSFRWKDWRGVPWQRASMQASPRYGGARDVKSCCSLPLLSLQHVWGDSLVSGWGLFEFIDMAEALDITPVRLFELSRL